MVSCARSSGLGWTTGQSSKSSNSHEGSKSEVAVTGRTVAAVTGQTLVAIPGRTSVSSHHEGLASGGSVTGTSAGSNSVESCTVASACCLLPTSRDADGWALRTWIAASHSLREITPSPSSPHSIDCSFCCSCCSRVVWIGAALQELVQSVAVSRIWSTALEDIFAPSRVGLCKLRSPLRPKLRPKLRNSKPCFSLQFLQKAKDAKDKAESVQSRCCESKQLKAQSWQAGSI